MNCFKQTRLILAALAALICFAGVPESARAQCQSYTTVTGTVTDPSGIPYAGATLYVDISPSAATSPSCTSVAGGQQTLSPSDLHKAVTLDSTGSFSIQVPPNAIISPASSSWVFTVNLNSPGPIGTGILKFTYSATISGSSQSLSSGLSALAQSVSHVSATPTGAAGGCAISGNYPNPTPGQCVAPNQNMIYVSPNCGTQTNCFQVASGSDITTALTAAVAAANALTQTTIGGSSFEPPTIQIAYGNYSYSSGFAPTSPVTIRCEIGTILNYTGSAHAIDLGPSGLTSSTLQQGEYTVTGCKFTGGASMTEGIFANEYITHVRIWGNTFTNFGNSTATVFSIWLDGFNYIADVGSNDWYTNDNTTRNGLKVNARDANTQLSFHDNQMANVNGDAATTCGTGGGIGVYVDGVGSRLVNNNFGCGWNPAVILGSSCTECWVGPSYFENLPSGSTTPVIEWTGNPLSGIHIVHAYYNQHSQASAYLMGPLTGTDTLINAHFSHISIANYSSSSAILLNNVAGQTGNSYEDIYSGTTSIATFHNAAGNIVPWTCYSTCGTGDYGMYLDQNAGLALFGAGEKLVVGGNGLVVASTGQYEFGSSGVTNPDTSISRLSAKGLALGIATNGDTTGNLSLAGVKIAGTKFTASGCTNSTLVGGASAGSYDSGTSGTCTVTITMGNSLTATNGWSCWANDLTTPADKQTQTGGSTTTAIISGTTVSGDVVNFGCLAY